MFMFVIRAEGLNKEWNGQLLFENINIEVIKGERVALIGRLENEMVKRPKEGLQLKIRLEGNRFEAKTLVKLEKLFFSRTKESNSSVRATVGPANRSGYRGYFSR